MQALDWVKLLHMNTTTSLLTGIILVPVTFTSNTKPSPVFSNKIVVPPTDLFAGFVRTFSLQLFLARPYLTSLKVNL